MFCTFWLRFRHLNFRKWSEYGVFWTFWLRNVLRATTACTFSSLIWPDGSAPAALASLLFDPPEPQIIGKTECFATFLPFRASASSFFWLFLFYHILSSALLFSLPLSISAFHLSILSEVWLLNFLRLPEAGMNTVNPARKPTGAKQQQLALHLHLYLVRFLPPWPSSGPISAFAKAQCMVFPSHPGTSWMCIPVRIRDNPHITEDIQYITRVYHGYNMDYYGSISP